MKIMQQMLVMTGNLDRSLVRDSDYLSSKLIALLFFFFVDKIIFLADLGNDDLGQRQKNPRRQVVFVI